MSIVLIVIGLIVGGILVGQDLINAAAVRAQIAQIEKYNSAVHTFQTKYGGYLPGDIPDPAASNFGFQPRGQYAGEGDGNGLLEGIHNDATNENSSMFQTAGEVVMFWRDLGDANLIDAKFTTASSTVLNYYLNSPSLFLPSAKIGRGNYLNVWSGGYAMNVNVKGDQQNYFGLSAVTQLAGEPSGWALYSTEPGLTVKEAYSIDLKIDDGLPQSGKVMALYINYNVETLNPAWAAGFGAEGAYQTIGTSGYITHGPTTSQTPYASTNCYDNGAATGAQQYSIAQNANLLNCALSFKFQ